MDKYIVAYVRIYASTNELLSVCPLRYCACSEKVTISKFGRPLKIVKGHTPKIFLESEERLDREINPELYFETLVYAE